MRARIGPVVSTDVAAFAVLGRAWVAVAAIGAIAVALLVAAPRFDAGSAPTTNAAIELAPFDGLVTPWVLPAPPAGLRDVGLAGQQGSTTAAYVAPDHRRDRVSVGHAHVAPEQHSTDLPSARAQRHEADGSWVFVVGYGRFASDAVVGGLLATARPAPRASPLDVHAAPSGWQLATFEDLTPTAGAVTLTPSAADPGGADVISIVRQPTTAADFPAGYHGQGPVSRTVSAGRLTVLMQGSEFWTLQLRLMDGGSLVLLLPVRMNREQVQRFADGVTAPAG